MAPPHASHLNLDSPIHFRRIVSFPLAQILSHNTIGARRGCTILTFRTVGACFCISSWEDDKQVVYIPAVEPRSCRWPLQRWSLDRRGTLSGGIPSSTKSLSNSCTYVYMGEWFPQLEQSRTAFVSIVAQSCREPFQRWNPYRKARRKSQRIRKQIIDSVVEG